MQLVPGNLFSAWAKMHVCEVHVCTACVYAYTYLYPFIIRQGCSLCLHSRQYVSPWSEALALPGRATSTQEPLSWGS